MSAGVIGCCVGSRPAGAHRPASAHVGHGDLRELATYETTVWTVRGRHRISDGHMSKLG